MKLEQIYTGCLSQGAYFIESEGEAVVIDPLREIQPYIQKAKRSNARIKYIFETHFHADFVSGHLDLARETGATIVYGPHAETSYPVHIAGDREVFNVGKLTFELLHTPGHTLESSCYLLKNEEGKDVALFTGDTLFIGDVGRPDLAQNGDGLSQEYLASLLYDSLHNKIIPLADDIVIYPAHGAGSACGKNMSRETFDTLGHQKETNYALQKGISKEEFIAAVTDGLQAPPAYFPINVQMNRQGYDQFQDVLSRGTKALTVVQFENAFEKQNALLLDTRNAQAFAKGFIPGAINIGLDGSFAPWVGTLIPYQNHPILLITDEGREEEAVTRLARIGYDHTVGYLQGGFNAWKEAGKPVDQIQSISVSQLATCYGAQKVNIVDVRTENEYAISHLPDAVHLPLNAINEKYEMLDKTRHYHVHCAGGYRSMVFISILRARGFRNLIDVKGGYKAILDYTGE